MTWEGTILGLWHIPVWIGCRFVTQDGRWVNETYRLYQPFPESSWEAILQAWQRRSSHCVWGQDVDTASHHPSSNWIVERAVLTFKTNMQKFQTKMFRRSSWGSYPATNPPSIPPQVCRMPRCWWVVACAHIWIWWDQMSQPVCAPVQTHTIFSGHPWIDAALSEEQRRVAALE